MGHDFKNMTAKQALTLAKLLSGKTCEDIAEETGFPYQSIRQYFKEHETRYFPGIHRIPALCRALGNNILIEWLHAQLEIPSHHPSITKGSELLKELNRLSSELGDVARVTGEALQDGKVDQQEAQQIIGEIKDVEEQCQKLKDGLQHVAGQVFEGGHFKKIYIACEE